MAVATEKIEEAELLIENVCLKKAHIKTLEICRWLLSFNKLERHQIKCYQTLVPDIRFCIDRGTDCDGRQIQTLFLVIRRNFEIGGLYPDNPVKRSYLQKNNDKWWRINYKDAFCLPADTIRECILQSYSTKLTELNLTSQVSIPAGKPAASLLSGEIPSRDDIFRILRKLGGEAEEDVFLNAVECYFSEQGRNLAQGWWDITKQSL